MSLRPDIRPHGLAGAVSPCDGEGVEALSIALCVGLLAWAMVAPHRAGLSYPWRVWAVLLPPVVLAYVGVRRVARMRAERGS